MKQLNSQDAKLKNKYVTIIRFMLCHCVERQKVNMSAQGRDEKVLYRFFVSPFR